MTQTLSTLVKQSQHSKKSNPYGHSHPKTQTPSKLQDLSSHRIIFRTSEGLGYFKVVFLLLEPWTPYIFINKMQAEDIECVFESMTGTGSIFISNYSAAQNLKLLHSLGIKAILSVARSGLINHKKEEIPHYLYIPAQDREDYPIYQHFDLTYDFIEKSRRQTNVLIHCMVGVSRSVTIVIAYLLKKYKYSLGQVISMIQRKRKKLNPNKGFIEQLKKFAEKEGIKCDFTELEVPRSRQNSKSRQIHSYSARKDRSFSKKPEHLSPITPPQKESNKEWNYGDKNVFYNQDLTNPLLKYAHLELKKGKTFQERTKQNEQQEAIVKEPSIGKQKLCLKKSLSVNPDASQRKRLSIEQKISKIRERIMKSDAGANKQASPSIYFNRRQYKNPAKRHIDPERSSNKFSYKSITKVIAQPHEIKESLAKLRASQTNNYPPESANGTIFSPQFKLEQKILYHVNPRANPRMNRLKQDANY